MAEWDEQLVDERIEQRRRRRPRFTDDRITLAHGAGGKATRALVEGLIVPRLSNDWVAALDDAAVLGELEGRVSFTTDTFVVTPIRFPGGSIGELAVNGTVNDLAVSGARPVALSLGLVLEEGLTRDELEQEIDAIAGAVEAAKVRVACGDTKVVERTKADRLYVNTSGIGIVDERADLGSHRIVPGDQVIVSGTIGDHGIAVMLARGELELAADVLSDTRPLWPVAEALLTSCGPGLRCMRDATRGGVATVANELVMTQDVGIIIEETALPVLPAVNGACELLGLDPLYVANEGKLVAIVGPDVALEAVAALRATEAGRDAAVIGEVVDEPAGRVLGRTAFGGHRMIDLLVGDPLPRIC
ncbi:MAG: hydrogenase expression/formation protein HypE [Acidimicrobiia bacterium]|nr:hydrogenase expression/formation protein HypE [Acidimicrobiia bacterium]